MRRFRCLLRLHDWRPMRFGERLGLRLVARECALCERFEIKSRGGYYHADREDFEPVVPA